MQAYHLTLPRHIDASLQLPASKSLSARALILSVLAHNSHVSGLSQCDDTRVLLDALQHRPDEINIGADIDFVGTMLEGVEQHAGVVTLRQSADMAVVGQYRQDQGAGGKALRRRQLKAGVDMAWQG